MSNFIETSTNDQI